MGQACPLRGNLTAPANTKGKAFLSSVVPLLWDNMVSGFDTTCTGLTNSLPVIQIARLSGFSPIVTTASLHNADYVKSLGATHLIDRKADVVAEARKIFSTPPSIVYDTISLDQQVGLDILAPNGTLIITLSQSSNLRKDGKKVVGTFGNVHVKRDIGRSLFSKLTQLLQSGDIKASALVETFHEERSMA